MLGFAVYLYVSVVSCWPVFHPLMYTVRISSVAGNSADRVASPEGAGRRHPRMWGARSHWVGVRRRHLKVHVLLPYLIYVLGGEATAAAVRQWLPLGRFQTLCISPNWGGPSYSASPKTAGGSPRGVTCLGHALHDVTD